MKQGESVKLKESVKNARPELKDHQRVALVSSHSQSSLAIITTDNFRAAFG